MIVSNAPVLEEAHVVCDWLEFAVLCSQYGTFSFASLQREWDIHRNQEDSDPEGGDSVEEAFIEGIKSEISERIRLLGEAYPFQLSDSGESLNQAVSFTFGQLSYLLCLILSHPKDGAVLSGHYLPPINNRIRDYFQAISTLAAADEVRGHSFSFGFPRPDHTGFLKKLGIIYSIFGESTVVVSAIPAGASPSPKDEQIDIIAWSPRQDHAAGKAYLLAQVASGANWDSKTIKGGPIVSFHSLWFQRPPASESTAAIYVPICFGNFIDNSNNSKIDARTYEFGRIFYRFLIPLQAARGLQLSQENKDLRIERTIDVEGITAWVNEQVNIFKNHNSYAVAS